MLGDPRAIAKFQERVQKRFRLFLTIIQRSYQRRGSKGTRVFTADDNLQQSVFDDAIAEQAKATAGQDL